jgi:hypothetical protein
MKIGRTTTGGVEAMVKEFLEKPENQEMLEEAKRAMAEAEKRVFGDNSAVQLRDLRRRVQQTCSLIATNGKIKECPGSNWSAHLESRTIFWRPTHPMPPFENLNADEVLYLCAHEASHLNYSGEYTTKPEDVDVQNHDDAHRFHRFVNAVEDIRCDRLSADDFPGFWPLGVNLTEKCYKEMAKLNPEQWNLADQVGLNMIWMSHGLAPIGTDDAKRISLEAWPEMSRVANCASTQEVADGIMELYKRMRDLDPGQTSGQNFSNGIGADSPTGQPVRSQGDTPGTMSPDEVLEGMAKDAQGGAAKAALEDAAQDARDAAEEGVHAAHTQCGETAPTDGEEMDEKMKQDAEAGFEPGPDGQPPTVVAGGGTGDGIGRGKGGPGISTWIQTREQMRGDINALYNKLRSVLKSNAMDSYDTGKRRGMLDSKRAYRAYAGNPRIFRKRTTVGDLDYTFGIIIDISGSMNGIEITNARATTVLIAEALDKAGLGLFVIPWDDGPAHLKPINEPLARHAEELGSYLSRGRGGTYEAPALVMAQEQMAAVKSGTKMLFVISDGGTMNPQESQQLAKEIQQSGVQVVAIGINFPPAAHYDHKLNVSSAAELIHVLPRFINEVVKRGHR